jgi:hypothetical protein
MSGFANVETPPFRFDGVKFYGYRLCFPRLCELSLHGYGELQMKRNAFIDG